jgi:hypothetical protein
MFATFGAGTWRPIARSSSRRRYLPAIASAEVSAMMGRRVRAIERALQPGNMKRSTRSSSRARHAAMRGGSGRSILAGRGAPWPCDRLHEGRLAVRSAGLHRHSRRAPGPTTPKIPARPGLARPGGTPGRLRGLRPQGLTMRTYVMLSSIPQPESLMRSNGLRRDFWCSGSHLRLRLARVGPTTPTHPSALPLTLCRLERLSSRRSFFASERMSPSARERVRPWHTDPAAQADMRSGDAERARKRRRGP